MKITSLTSCCVDHFPEENKTYVGGNSLNFATQCKLLGYPNTHIVGGIGHDPFGERIEKYFAKCGLDRSRLYKTVAPTASNKIYIDENGDRYFKEDSWNGEAFDIFRLSEEDWEFVLESDLIAMPAGDPNLEELLKRRTKDHVVAVDFLDYLGLDFIEKHIDAIDLVFLSGKEEMLADLQALSTSKHTLLVPTLGAQGSLAFYENKMYKQEALEVETIVDSTGCGDAFQAAFCLEWIGSKDIQNSLYAGALAAQKVLGYMGGVNTDF